MKSLKVLVSAAGAPGCSTLIRQLQNIEERKVSVVAVDMDEEAIGRFIADSFYSIPPADHEDYISAISDIIIKEKIDVFYVVSSAEILVVAQNKEKLESLGCKVLASDPSVIELAEDKYKLYKTLSENTNVSVPDFHLVDSLEKFTKAVEDLGYPEKQVCFKPPISKGSRGFRILSADINRKDLLLNHKPESLYMSLEEFKQIFENEDFPPFLVMELVTGQAYDAMVLADRGDPLLTTVKTREASRWGIIVKGELVDSPDHVQSCYDIIKEIPLSYNIGIQFIGKKIIEINPRPSTFIYQPDLIEPYIAIKFSIGELQKEDILNLQSNINYGRRMVRYMDQVFFDKK